MGTSSFGATETVKVFDVINIVVFSVFCVLETVQGVGLKGFSPSPCNFRAVYNFGDSNSDTGGGSAAFWVAGFPPGETFFHRPVGRASDGRMIIDFIGKKTKKKPFDLIYNLFLWVN